MELRSIRRFFKINHALFLYNKKNPKLTPQLLVVLAAVSFTTKKKNGIGATQLFNYLTRHKRGMELSSLCTRLKVLEELGYIKKQMVGKKNLISLTLFGNISLQDIERFGRALRIDK